MPSKAHGSDQLPIMSKEPRCTVPDGGWLHHGHRRPHTMAHLTDHHQIDIVPLVRDPLPAGTFNTLLLHSHRRLFSGHLHHKDRRRGCRPIGATQDFHLRALHPMRRGRFFTLKQLTVECRAGYRLHQVHHLDLQWHHTSWNVALRRQRWTQLRMSRPERVRVLWRPSPRLHSPRLPRQSLGLGLYRTQRYLFQCQLRAYLVGRLRLI